DDPEALALLAEASALMGRVAADQGDADAAADHYREMVDARRRLAEPSDSPDSWLDLASALAALAGVLADPDDAWPAIDEAVAILRRVEGRGGAAREARAFEILLLRARLHHEFGRPQEAIADYEEAVAVARALADDPGTWVE